MISVSIRLRRMIALAAIAMLAWTVHVLAAVQAAQAAVPLIPMGQPPTGPWFEENLGQLDREDVRYFDGRGPLDVGFAEGRVYFCARRRPDPAKSAWHDAEHVLFALDLGQRRCVPEGIDPLPGRSHYLIGPRSDQWARGIRHYGRIRYRDVRPGTDLIYFFDKGQQLSYEFTVNPGADPSDVELSYQGIRRIVPRGPSAMVVATAAGGLRDGNLLCYQDVEGERREVLSRFQVRSRTSYGVELLEPYDTSRPLVIDPKIAFATYGGSIAGGNRTVVLDTAGSIYTAGAAAPSEWPRQIGRVSVRSGWPNVAITKLDSKGKLLWATHIGGPNEDYAYVSAVNPQGELYVAGRAGNGFPITPAAFDRAFHGGTGAKNIHSATDCFVLKLSADGTNLVYSTYIGGDDDENGRAIHLFPSGELLVGGGPTRSTNLPTTPGALTRSRPGLSSAWLAKLSAAGSRLEFCTYFGPGNAGFTHLRGLGADAGGNVWLAGTTNGTNLEPTANAFQKAHRGGLSECYVAKLSPDATKLLYFSWLGGKYRDDIETEGLSDSQGNFYLAGSTSSPDFPTSPGAFQTSLRGGGKGSWAESDAFVVKVNHDGSLGFSTLFGGSRIGPGGRFANPAEVFFGPAVDRKGNVYCFGSVVSHDCPVTADAFQRSKADPEHNSRDGFLAVFSPHGRDLLYGTYLGGTGQDMGRFVAIDPGGRLVAVTGETDSSDLPVVNAHQSRFTPKVSSFVAAFDVTDIDGGTEE
ncbi:MAG: DUF7948 domain-containing protein [Planctomycetota bacterium]|jgi:hypothetical protein